MFCEKCGNKISQNETFCTKCGNAVGVKEMKKNKLDEKWWQRLLKVGYIILYSPLLLIVPIAWSSNSSDYVYSSFGGGHYEDTYEQALFYTLLSVFIYLAIIRLIKLATLYITLGEKPLWKNEFKKFF